VKKRKYTRRTMPARTDDPSRYIQDLVEERLKCLERVKEIEATLAAIVKVAQQIAPRPSFVIHATTVGGDETPRRLCACGCGLPAAPRKGKTQGRSPKYAVGHSSATTGPATVVVKPRDEAAGLEVVASGRNAARSSDYLGSTLNRV
jgi:hypothetical protein